MCGDHVSACVIHGSAGDVCEEVDEELFFSFESIVASVLPESCELGVVHESWE